MNQHTHKLDLIEWGVPPFYNYRGCLIEKIYGVGFKVLNQMAYSPAEVDVIIMQSENNLELSIDRGKEK